ncbi:hypothetical protein [Clostridium estertheticum]|uniref:hypothetical protein n=1 Tax=Clostridium estertheticum TaxID=238834 RepID=UPI001CF557A5|nr:hypothetical protein [Clostridium estertheticum]MCB2339098.1 hypothetical protein [Clostridium estertheticum]
MGLMKSVITNVPNAITTGGIMLTCFIGIANIVYSIVNNRKTRFINTVTTSRITWISELRNYISDYISLIPLDSSIYMDKYTNRNEFFQNFYKKKLLIELMLNKEDDFDKNMQDVVIEIYNIVEEIYKCENLIYKGKLLDYEKLDTKSKELTINRLVEDLDNNTAKIIKEIYIELLEITKNNIITMDAKSIIKMCEFKGINRIDDIYIICINKLVGKLRDKIGNLVESSQNLLKKEWDRVKKESEKGKYIGNERNIRSYFLIMLLCIIVLFICFIKTL